MQWWTGTGHGIARHASQDTAGKGRSRKINKSCGGYSRTGQGRRGEGRRVADNREDERREEDMRYKERRG